MHEMSIVANILDIAGRQAAAAGARRINRIEVEVGDLAGVDRHSLEFCFRTARLGEALAADAELVIHPVPGRGRCGACGTEAAVDFFVAVCPECGAAGMEILSGRELKVRSINID